MRMAVVYGSPLDFTGEFVAREFRVHRVGQEPGEVIAHSKSLDHVRSMVKLRGFSGAVKRKAEDDPTIIEIWL